ncbi:MAG: hypothetical protein ACFFAO_12445 [Candidatus Hermodarchaeota archaeon]
MTKYLFKVQRCVYKTKYIKGDRVPIEIRKILHESGFSIFYRTVYFITEDDVEEGDLVIPISQEEVKKI